MTTKILSDVPAAIPNGTILSQLRLIKIKKSQNQSKFFENYTQAFSIRRAIQFASFKIAFHLTEVK